MSSTSETGQVTGTKDKDYNLIWFTEQCLSNALRLESYIQDAERDGDSELAEGSVWEAFDKASYYQLGNLCAILDINRLGQRGPTEFEWDLDAYRHRIEAFGGRPILIVQSTAQEDRMMTLRCVGVRQRVSRIEREGAFQ